MKKSVAKQIAKVWNAMSTTEATKTKAVVECNAVEIYPDGENTGNAFYHAEELVGISAAFRVSSYISIRERDVDGEVRNICVGRIY